LKLYYKFCIVILILILSFSLAGCGGGGGDAIRNTFLWLPDNNNNNPSASSATVLEVNGTVASSPASPSLSAVSRAIDFKNGNYAISVVDLNDSKISQTQSEFNGPDTFRAAIALNTDSTRQAFLLITTPSGKQLYKKYLGKIPAISAGNKKLTGLKIDDDSTARAVIALSDRTKIPSVSIFSVSNGKTNSETLLESSITSIDDKISELSKIIKMLAQITVKENLDSSIKDKIKSTTFSSLSDLLKDYVELIKLAAALQNAGISVTPQISIGGLIINGSSAASEIETAANQTKSDFSTLPFISIENFTVTKDLSGNYKISWKTSLAVKLKAVVSFATSNTPLNTDKSYTESISTASTDHAIYINGSEISYDFIKIRLAYQSSDENSPYLDLLKHEINNETLPPETIAFSSVQATKEASGNYTITWATGKTTSLKALICFLNADNPGSSDKNFSESAAAASTSHTFNINAADIPASFIKIRINYTNSAGNNYFADILKSDIKDLSSTGVLSITSAAVVREISGNYKISWKTNKPSSVKAKMTFWTNEMPNTEDPSFFEAAVSSETDHSFTVNAAEIPSSFVKVRLSYQVSEEEGAFLDIMKSEITDEPVPNNDPISITEISGTKDGSGNHVISWKTNKPVTVKAKITFWTNEMPNTEDKSFWETLTSSTSHSISITAAESPSSFIKVRVSYQISEDEGAYSDLEKVNIVSK